ncbi:hypothetical protein QBC38DRAFT_520552 [Podospora fimiseda]|uniref:LysM domain-containing protein n=1 Tax=Podospora fimiseda TaxID=252190 RepID=A0AAN7BDR5_9PEZI|nr:hypothetical protein QBC38DRAFT_520552 [Podospora fimiseda]
MKPLFTLLLSLQLPVIVTAQSIPKRDTYNPRCTHFTRFVPGMTCNSIAKRYNILVSDIFAWNTELKPECSNLATIEYVCVGVLDGPGDPMNRTLTYDLNYVETETVGPYPQPT